MTRFRFACTSLLLLGLTGLFPAPPAARAEQVWFQPPESALPKIHRIVLTRTEVDGALVTVDSSVAGYDSLLAQVVRDAGYEVVPGWVHRSLWNGIADSLLWGTDESDGARQARPTDAFALARARELRGTMATQLASMQMRETHDPDAWLVPSISMVALPFTNGRDGAVLVEVKIVDRGEGIVFRHQSTNAMMYKRDPMGQFPDAPAERWLLERKHLGNEFKGVLKAFLKETEKLRKQGRMGPPS